MVHGFTYLSGQVFLHGVPRCTSIKYLFRSHVCSSKSVTFYFSYQPTSYIEGPPLDLSESQAYFFVVVLEDKVCVLLSNKNDNIFFKDSVWYT